MIANLDCLMAFPEYSDTTQSFQELWMCVFFSNISVVDTVESSMLFFTLSFTRTHTNPMNPSLTKFVHPQFLKLTSNHVT